MADDGAIHPKTAPPDGPGYREKRFSVDDFFQLGDLGALNDPYRYELWDGRLVVTPPFGGFHNHSEARLVSRFVLALSKLDLLETTYVAQPGPGLEMSEDTFLQPDFAVLSPVDPAAHPRFKPEHVHLCAEVSRSTLAEDLGSKRKRYAAAQIPEYWVLNTIERTLHVFRDPSRGDYRAAFEAKGEAPVSPLFEPRVSLSPQELFRP